MPSPPTTILPRPKSWEEFEIICADLLKRLWGDPYTVRHGRSGQQQFGVDIFGRPNYLRQISKDRFAGAQCKLTDVLTVRTVKEEVEKAARFKPPLYEFLVMTTAARDVILQQEIRTIDWPFYVHIMFWDDISLEISGHDDLLNKHYPGWIRKGAKKDEVLNLILSSNPEDFQYNDGIGEYFHMSDTKLRVVLERGSESELEFDEPWVRKFPDHSATRQPVYIYYEQTRVHHSNFVFVDGGRHIIPIPKNMFDLTINPFEYHLGSILNHTIPGHGFDYALNLAGIVVKGGEPN